MADPTQTPVPASADVVVAGGGFAGAATAFHLARLGVRDVVVIEADDQFGSQASGLNAAMARQVVGDAATGAMLRSSVAGFVDAWARDAGFRPCGSLLLLGGEGEQGLLGTAREAAAAGLDCRVADRDEVVARVPVLEDTPFTAAISTASDGVVDIHALLWKYLGGARAAGASLAAACPVTGVETSGGRVVAVLTPRGRVACRLLVDAAGAWANRVAALAGLPPLPMTPYRRHLAVTPPVPGVNPGWPFVWHVGACFYFRPEVGGLLLSPCDQTPAEPGPSTRDPAAIEDLARKLARNVPALADLPVKRYWAGLRTITADTRFAIGPDPRLSGFFWVAGLGGHGMTGSWAVGKLAAELIAGAAPGADAAPVAPARFL
jgi:glycine/D-amino acid oxidase-like deaminating enzyme